MPERSPGIETINASEARRHWSRLVNRVFRGETRVLVEKSGIPVAAIISAGDLQRLNWLEAERAERFKALEESWEAFTNVNPEEVEEEVAKAVHSAREKERRRAQHVALTS